MTRDARSSRSPPRIHQSPARVTILERVSTYAYPKFREYQTPYGRTEIRRYRGTMQFCHVLEAWRSPTYVRAVLLAHSLPNRQGPASHRMQMELPQG